MGVDEVARARGARRLFAGGAREKERYPKRIRGSRKGSTEAWMEVEEDSQVWGGRKGEGKFPVAATY